MAAATQQENFLVKNSNKDWHLKLKTDINNFENAINNQLENSEKYIKLLKGLKYWNTNFQAVYDKNRFIFTLFNEQLDTKINIPQVVKHIANMVGKNNITSLYFPRNAKYLGIDFINEKIKEKVEKNFLTFENFYIVPATWGGLSAGIDIRAHWLPVDQENIEKLKAELNKYVKIIKIYNEEFIIDSELTYKSSVINIRAVPIEDKLTDQIPHLLKINNRTTLITVKGRQPICLNCNSIGHKSAECIKKKCKVCYSFYEGEHTNCYNNKGQLSYAALVKSKTTSRLEIEVKESDLNDLKKSKKLKLDNETKSFQLTNVHSTNSLANDWANHSLITDPDFEEWQRQEASKSPETEKDKEFEKMMEQQPPPELVTLEEFNKNNHPQIQVLRRSNRKKPQVSSLLIESQNNENLDSMEGIQTEENADNNVPPSNNILANN